MNRLVLGMLFVFLDIPLELGSATLELLPDFAGYLLMMKGLRELALDSAVFQRGETVALVMAVIHGIHWLMDFFAGSVQADLYAWLVGLAVTVLDLVLTYWVVKGVEDMERRNHWQLQGRKLRSMWLIQLVLTILCALLNWLPLVGTVCVIASFVVAVCFLVAMNDTRKRYYQSKNGAQ